MKDWIIIYVTPNYQATIMEITALDIMDAINQSGLFPPAIVSVQCVNTDALSKS